MPDSSNAEFKGYTLGEGVKDGLPIGLGYLSVSFTFGILCVSKGLSSAFFMVQLSHPQIKRLTFGNS